MLTIQNRKEGNATVVTVKGKMTFDAIHPLNSHLQEILASQRPSFLVLNLEEVHHVDSSGIGLLVASRNMMNRNMGQLYLCGLHAHVKDVFAKMNLLNYFSVLETEQEALEGIRLLARDGDLAACDPGAAGPAKG